MRRKFNLCQASRSLAVAGSETSAGRGSEAAPLWPETCKYDRVALTLQGKQKTEVQSVGPMDVLKEVDSVLPIWRHGNFLPMATGGTAAQNAMQHKGINPIDSNTKAACKTVDRKPPT